MTKLHIKMILVLGSINNSTCYYDHSLICIKVLE